MTPPHKITVGISGASGVHLGERFLESLPKSIEAHRVYSESALTVKRHEERCYDNADIAAPIASGSFGIDATAIIPCSMNTLAKIACGIADDLITRAAAVMIKERKTLLLAPREMPFSPIALENMKKLSDLGVIIAPPVLGYYAQPESLQSMEDFLIGKWFDLLQIPHQLYARWGNPDA